MRPLSIKKLALFLIFLLIVLIATVSISDSNNEAIPNNKISSPSIYEIEYDSISDGYSRSYYKHNSLLAAEGKLIGGKKDSLWIYYRIDGSISKTSYYKQDILEGLTINYYSNGLKYAEAKYLNGELNGKEIVYYEDGKTILSISQYKHGKLDGKAEKYEFNGLISSITHFKNGIKHGSYTEYDFIQKNQRHYISKKGGYEYGKEHGEWRYYSYYYDITTDNIGNNLILTDLRNYKAGKLHGKVTEFDLKYGFKLIEIEYMEDLEHGIKKNYCPSGRDRGKLWFTEEFVRGVRIKRSDYFCDCPSI